MWFRRSRLVIPPESFYQPQLHKRGCGVAVLAMIMERQYQVVLSSIRPPVDFDRNGMKLDVFFNYLFDEGYAIVARDRPKRDERRPWPLDAWAPGHVLIVKKRWWHQLHLAYMLHDGRIFDPHYGEVDIGFYWRIYTIVGIYKVAAAGSYREHHAPTKS